MSLVVDSITKRFGSVVALDGVSFSVEPGARQRCAMGVGGGRRVEAVSRATRVHR